MCDHVDHFYTKPKLIRQFDNSKPDDLPVITENMLV